MAMVGYLNELRERLALNDAMRMGFDYLARLTAADFAGLGEGETRRVEIDGERVFALNQTYATSPERAAKFEGHRRYLDLQFIFGGEETMLVAARRDSATLIDYDAEKDVEFFSASRGPVSSLAVGAGMVAVFYPEDIHAPCQMSDHPAVVLKCVIKVEI